MKNIWNKNKIWLRAIAYLMAIVALVWGVILSVNHKIIENSFEFKKNKADNEFNLERIGKIGDMKKTHDMIEQKKNNLNIILDNNNELDFIKMLENIADETGNKIKLKMDFIDPSIKSGVAVANTVSPNPDAVKVAKIEIFNINHLDVHINLSGDYNQMLSFLNKLENMGYLVNVTALDLKKDIYDPKNEDASATNVSSFSLISSGNSSSNKADQNEKEILHTKIDAVVYLKN